MAPLPTTAARLLRAQAKCLLLALAPDKSDTFLELSPVNPLVPVAFAGGLAIYAPETGFALLPEGGAK